MSTTEYSKEEVENEKKKNNCLGQSETEGYIRIRYYFVGTITKTKKPFSLQAAQI